MPVQDTHPDYDRLKPQWVKMRDASEGQIAVHAKTTQYLERLSGQTDEEYKSYMERATFYEATGRTIDGLKGMIFRNAPLIEDGAMMNIIEDVTLEGDSLRAFAENITEEILITNRLGVLVEHPRVEITEGMTRAQAELLNARPYLKCYKAEQILNWRTAKISNSGALVEVRLHEIIEEQIDEYDYKEIEQIRVLKLSEGIYKQAIYRKSQKAKWELFEDDIIPLMNGQAINYIPFVFFSDNGTNPDIKKPALTGLVNTNLSHYKTTADLEHGAHFTGLPTAVVSGVNESDDGEYRIGSSMAWVFSDPSAKASYLEFTGSGLGALEKRIEIKEAQMASLGAQMLTPQSRRNESTDTAAMRHMGENSILSNISQAISEGLNLCLEIVGEWTGLEPATIVLNKDFMPVSMSPQMLQQLVASWQSGAISGQTLFENLKKGEIIDSAKNYEDERDEIETAPILADAT